MPSDVSPWRLSCQDEEPMLGILTCRIAHFASFLSIDIPRSASAGVGVGVGELEVHATRLCLRASSPYARGARRAVQSRRRRRREGGQSPSEGSSTASRSPMKSSGCRASMRSASRSRSCALAQLGRMSFVTRWRGARVAVMGDRSGDDRRNARRALAAEVELGRDLVLGLGDLAPAHHGGFVPRQRRALVEQ